MPDNKDTNDEFSWMSDFDQIVPPTNEPPITNSEVPGWLSELEPSNNDQPDESKSEPSDDDDLPWMSSDESEDDDDALFDDVPDWLSAAEPDSMQLSAASNDDDDGSDLDWMTALDEDESAAPVAPPVDDEFAWMSAIEEAPAAAAVPDWLSELAPAPTSTPAAEPVIQLEFQAAIGQADPHDRILLDSEPPIDMLLKGGVHGDVATVAIAVNCVGPLLAATPGLHTMATIPMARFRPAS